MNKTHIKVTLRPFEGGYAVKQLRGAISILTKNNREVFVGDKLSTSEAQVLTNAYDVTVTE